MTAQGERILGLSTEAEGRPNKLGLLPSTVRKLSQLYNRSVLVAAYILVAYLYFWVEPPLQAIIKDNLDSPQAAYIPVLVGYAILMKLAVDSVEVFWQDLPMRVLDWSAQRLRRDIDNASHQPRLFPDNDDKGDKGGSL